MKLGKAFSDSLIVEQKVVRKASRDPAASWWFGVGRALVFSTIFFLAFFFLFWRLFDLTLVRGREFRALSDSNRTRELVRHAARGILLDRTGKPLVENIPQYRLRRPCDEGSDPCSLELTRQEGEQMKQEGLPAGWYLEEDYQRTYTFNETLAHAVGYVGEITDSELADDYYQLRGYRPGDRLGRMGAEAVLEEELRGRDGKELVEVDAAGNVVRTLGSQAAVPGGDISLSLDAKLSQVVAASFPPDAKGAVVVTKPSTGEILALYTQPSFSPNAFAAGMTADEYQTIIEDPDLPMFNRAIGGVYPPGSTFKIVTAIAALEEQAITPTTTVEDIGVITIGSFQFPNWYFTQYGKTEGLVDIVKAIQRSNDIFFYKVGEWLGITKLAAWARKVGVGRTLGIELAGEAEGLMPDPTWKREYFTSPEDLEGRNNEWYLGDTYHVSIGQGYLLTTPLQVNEWTNVIANNGKFCRPTIVKQKTENRKQRTECRDLGIKKETIDLITEGMRQACAAGGTGWPLFEFKIEEGNTEQQFIRVPVACKTGTAEYGDPQDRTHAWFTVFAPLRLSLDFARDRSGQAQEDSVAVLSGEPEISVTVLVEEAGEGSNVAAPIAKKILEEWFGR